MVTKGGSGEEKAWKEYLASVEGEQATTKKKRIPLSKMLRKILQRIGIGKKAREAREVEKQIAISAAEGRKISRKKPAVEKELPATKAFAEDIKRLEKDLAKVEKVEDIRRLEKGLAKVEKVEDIRRLEKGLAKVEKEETAKGKPLRIEKYLEMVEGRRKAEAEKRVREEKPAKAIEKKQAAREEKRPEKAVEKEEKPAKAIEKKVAKVVESGKRLAERVVPKKVLMLPTAEAGRKLVISKKVAFLPRAEKARKAIAKRKKVVLLPRAKRKKAAGKAVAKRVMRWKAERKPMRLPKMVSVRGKELAMFLGGRPSLVEKSVAEIKKLSKKEVKKEVRLERIASRARGWYGEALRHQRAASAGWRIRKRVRLHFLRKKAKKKKLTLREWKEKKALLSEDRKARQRIKELDTRIVALKRIAREKGGKRRLLEKKVRAAGVKIPKAKISPIERGRRRFRKRSEMLDLVDAMRSVADEMAAAATKQTMAGAGWTDTLTLKDRIRAQQKLIKGLERAFYKRRISFEQFREKMFEYQSKLSEMKIKKNLIEKRMARLPPEMKEAIRKKALLEQKAAKQEGVGITPKAAKALEKFAEKPVPKVKVGKETAEAIKKLAEKEVEKEAKKAEEKKFAERTAEALQKIVKRLGAMPKPVPRPPQPARPAPIPPPRREEETYALRRPAIKPIKRGGMERIRKAIEEEERKEAMAAARRKRKGKTVKKVKEKKPKERIVEKAEEKKPKERIVEKAEEKKKKERIVERVREKIFGRGKAREKPKVSKVVDKAIKQKAAGSGVSKQQIDKVEEKLGELLEKYNIPDSALAAHIRTLDSNRLVQDFQKLIQMIEAKKKSATAELIRPAPGFDIKTGIIARKRERIVGKEKEIRYAKIETSFDKVLRLVQIKGITNLNKVAKQLGMSKKKVQECAEVLERSRLIKLRYPPIGAVKLIYPGYLKWKVQEKKKKREEKRRKKKR